MDSDKGRCCSGGKAAVVLRLAVEARDIGLGRPLEVDPEVFDLVRLGPEVILKTRSIDLNPISDIVSHAISLLFSQQTLKDGMSFRLVFRAVESSSNDLHRLSRYGKC